MRKLLCSLAILCLSLGIFSKEIESVDQREGSFHISQVVDSQRLDKNPNFKGLLTTVYSDDFRLAPFGVYLTIFELFSPGSPAYGLSQTFFLGNFPDYPEVLNYDLDLEKGLITINIVNTKFDLNSKLNFEKLYSYVATLDEDGQLPTVLKVK